MSYPFEPADCPHLARRQRDHDDQCAQCGTIFERFPTAAAAIAAARAALHKHDESET